MRQVIKGWTEAMQMMKEGDRWELFIPSGEPDGGIACRIPIARNTAALDGHFLLAVTYTVPYLCERSWSCGRL